MAGPLTDYFSALLERVETTEVIQNDGKDENGFYSPTRTLAIRHLSLLRDLHAKPMAQAMVRDSWKWIAEHLPPDWLVLTAEQKAELKKIL